MMCEMRCVCCNVKMSSGCCMNNGRNSTLSHTHYISCIPLSSSLIVTVTLSITHTLSLPLSLTHTLSLTITHHAWCVSSIMFIAYFASMQRPSNPNLFSGLPSGILYVLNHSLIASTVPRRKEDV